MKIYPRFASGKIILPPSKSISHRAIICASLSFGKSIISNIDYSQDIVATIDAMEKLGSKIEKKENYLIVNGIKNFDIDECVVDCNESGSTLRFMIPIFSLTDKKIKFIGKNRLLKRPQMVYEDIFKGENLKYIHTDKFIEIKGALKGGKYKIRGDISSQFISGLLFTLPLLTKPSEITVLPPFESKSYVGLTIDMLSKFGIKIDINGDKINIPANQKYTACNIEIDGDYSQLSFFAVLGVLNGNIDCLGVDKNSRQGDKKIIDILRKCGGKITSLSNGYNFKKSDITRLTVNVEDCPDIAPILMVLGAFSRGKFTITGAKRLRYKESDRILAMETELKKLGVDIISNEDNIYITGKKEYLGGVEVYSHNDHRIAMSLAIFGMCCRKEITIKNSECVNKSYPKFFEDLDKLR